MIVKTSEYAKAIGLNPCDETDVSTFSVIDALESIEAAAQGNARLEALALADKKCPELRYALFLALSGDVTFGIKKLPPPSDDGFKEVGKFNTHNIWWAFFCGLAHKLRTREWTGNHAQHTVAIHLGMCQDPLQRKWAERILKQDLRINLGAKDVNNALGEGTIYIFEVPLATDFAKVKPKELKGTWAVQPKLDGGRCVAILPGDGGPVRLLSRTGKEWGNFESIKSALQNYNNNRSSPKTIYLDGEVVSYVDGAINFQAIQKVLHAKDGREVGTLQYVIFDAALEEEWKNPQLSYEARLDFAAQTVSGIPDSNIRLIPTLYVEDPTPFRMKEECYFFVQGGYEGAMFRRSDKPVQNKRSKDLLKVKSFTDSEAKIVGKVEGTGKLQGVLGALKCEWASGVAFEIGTGFSDAVRKELWEADIIGQQANFKYFEVTDAGAPRFPVFRAIRHPEDM